MPGRLLFPAAIAVAQIGHRPFVDLVSAYDLRVNYKPMLLVDLFSQAGGLPLAKRHPERQRYRMIELQGPGPDRIARRRVEVWRQAL